LGVGVTVGVGFAVGVAVGLGFGLGFATEGEPDDERAADADVDEGAVDEPGTTDPGVFKTDDDVPGSEDAGADELAGGSDCAELAWLVGTRSIAAATMSPPSSTRASVPTTTRSRTVPGKGIAVRSP
jgi:hypothetical protein